MENANKQDKAVTGKKLSPLRATFASFRHRNYRLFFFAQLVSLIGLHMQWTAQGWLVYDMTDSKFALGFIRMLATVPFLLSIFGGDIADRFRRRSILVVTQSFAVIPPIALAALVLTDSIEIWHIAVLASLSGFIAAVDMPTRQSFVIDLVGREDLMNAIGLNSGLFNTARIVGPAVAGALMTWIGMAYCFLSNGLTYIPVVIALLMMRLPGRKPEVQRGRAWNRLRAGFGHVRHDWRLIGLFGLLAVVGVFGFSYMALMPAFAKDVFGLKPAGFGELMALNGVGAVIGSLIVASMGKRKGKRQVLFAGVMIFSLGITAFSLTGSFAAGLACLVFVGIGMIMFMATTNTLIQAIVSDELRGRVMGIFAFVFGGTMPAGSILAGTAAEYIGLGLTVRIGALVCACAALVASIVGRRIKAPQAPTESPEVPEKPGEEVQPPSPQIPY